MGIGNCWPGGAASGRQARTVLTRTGPSGRRGHQPSRRALDAAGQALHHAVDRSPWVEERIILDDINRIGGEVGHHGPMNAECVLWEKAFERGGKQLGLHAAAILFFFILGLHVSSSQLFRLLGNGHTG